MSKFKNKYRIESTRLQNWDYGRNAAYFVTICTQNREHFFGVISNGNIHLSEIGCLAEKFWNEIPNHFPFVNLDSFIIMPNHIHGIIIINKTDDDKNDKSITGINLGREAQTPKLDEVQTSKLDVSTAAASQKWKPATLGSIINQYKRICTIKSRKINENFAWQPRFYDHIIRDDKAYQNIKNYIINNPENWENDSHNNNNLTTKSSNQENQTNQG